MKICRIGTGIIMLLLVCACTVNAQDLSAIGQEKPLSISGSLAATQISYQSFGRESRRDPFSYFLSGALNISLYGWSVPFSINYSNQQTTFHQPFNQYGLSPSYQWVTAHLGWRSMQFSPYTLAGHTFLGAGVEMNPGKWRIAAMYGRLNKAVAHDSSSAAANLPVYERFGFGCKIGIGSATDYIDFVVFRAKDDPNSIALPPAATGMMPAENLVTGINFSKQLIRGISVSGEWACSAYTRDVRADTVRTEGYNPYAHLGKLFTPLTSTSYYQAFKTTLTYTGKQYGLHTAYERMDPGYQTMGGYFFNDDMENITIGGNTQLWQKLSFSGNVGIQQNNLAKDQADEQTRLLSAVNLNYTPSEVWNVSGAYSNFTTNARRSPRLHDIVHTVDTVYLTFVQITNHASIDAGYSNRQGDNTYGVSMSISGQLAYERQGVALTDRQTRFYSSHLTYYYRVASTDMGFTASLQANRTSDPDMETSMLGPSLSCNKSFYEKKLKTVIAAACHISPSVGVQSGRMLSTRMNTRYNLNKNSFSLSMVMMNSRAANVYTELTATLAYSYSF